MPGESGHGLFNIAQYGANWFLVQIGGRGLQPNIAEPVRARDCVVAPASFALLSIDLFFETG